jgi:carbonic anhydrase/acetyltransferase-like protein (isoleucine patch superfamily)
MNNIRSFEQFHPQIGNKVYIDPAAVVIGNVQIADHVSIWPFASIRADVNRITIGEMSNIQDGAILHVTHDGPFTPGGQELHIGKGVTVGHQAVLHGCEIHDFSLIGIQSVVLDGAIIKHHVMLAAGSLVPPGKTLESGYLYLGNPAKKKRALTKKEIQFLEYSSSHYLKLKNNYI